MAIDIYRLDNVSLQMCWEVMRNLCLELDASVTDGVFGQTQHNPHCVASSDTYAGSNDLPELRPDGQASRTVPVSA